MSRRIGLKGDGWVRVVIPELPWRVEVKIARVDGAPQILGLRLEPDVDDDERLQGEWRVRDVVISTQALRRLPLVRLRAAASQLHRLELDEVFKALTPPTRKPGQPLPPSHFDEVATVYRAAVDGGQHPLLAICRKWQVKRPTASRWVRAARETGILGWPTRRGVPGYASDQPPATSRTI